MKITVIGSGYVGLSNAVLLSQKNEVVVLDLVEEKIQMLNRLESPIDDDYIKEYLTVRKLNLSATLDKNKAIKNADYIIIAVPTNFNDATQSFETEDLKKTIKDIIKINQNSVIVIKSTVPIGFTESLRKHLDVTNIIFSPEFLREGKALFDNLYPSRIIVGEVSERAKKFAKLLADGAIKKDIKILYTNSSEAEAIKLFSNGYLAMRVAFFNELDSFAEIENLNTESIIEGMSFDPRIGSHYNNPSFGYGGYCFPKDTKQLLTNFKNIPNNLVKAIVDSNSTRKDHIANAIISKKPKIVGIYRLIMKSDSDNFRFSSILGVIERLKMHEIHVQIYEPSIDEVFFNNIEVISDLQVFKSSSDLILANRLNNEIIDAQDKVYSRDIFNNN
ncbi:nucleotide sugar dehydrogenase [Pseudothioglobus sp. nBUS_23]|uniref:nucleotide sugar dehydrogenase n=1 Tax=Pseudothioglobus sp. nBUS_23 TaxID=3395318 RepID=UPI003EBA2B7A